MKHRWEKTAEHTYRCTNECGLQKVSRKTGDGPGDWTTDWTWNRPECAPMVRVGGPTPPCPPTPDDFEPAA